MARVNITDKLIEEVRWSIGRMKAQALETEAPEPPAPEYDFQTLVDSLWGEDIHLMGMFVGLNNAGKLGRDLKEFTSGKNITVYTKAPDGTSLQLPHAGCPWNVKVYGPPKLDPSSYNTPSITLPPEHPLAVPFVERHQKAQEVNQRFRDIQHDIVSFLRKCPSLNEAVKLVPEVVMYLPGWAKVKLEEKVVRTKRVAPTLPSELPDVERMVVTAITHRMESS